MSVHIRIATGKDLNDVFEMILAFAEFEKLSHQIQLTAQEFLDDGTSGHYECAVAEQQGKLVGYALYFPLYSSFQGRRMYLEDIYVAPEARGTGVGTAMFNAVIQGSTSIGSKTLRFACLKWNTKAMDFYKKAGVINSTESGGQQFWKIDQIALQHLASANLAGGEMCVRPATVADASALLSLITDSAQSMKVSTTQLQLQELKEQVFGSAPLCKYLIAEQAPATADTSMVGYVCYSSAYSTFQGKCIYLEELFVREADRRKGVGQRLLAALAQECVSMGCCKLQFVTMETNEAAVKFSHKMNAINLTKEEEWDCLLLNHS